MKLSFFKLTMLCAAFSIAFLQATPISSPGMMDITVRVLNTDFKRENLRLTLNEQVLTGSISDGYQISADDVVVGSNTLEAHVEGLSLFSISALDLVFLMKGMIEGDLTPVRAITGDFDQSGSLSTRDLLQLSNRILGVEEDTEPRVAIVSAEEDFSNFDIYDFDPKYLSYQFDGSNAPGQIDIEVFEVGDVNTAISTVH